MPDCGLELDDVALSIAASLLDPVFTVTLTDVELVGHAGSREPDCDVILWDEERRKGATLLP